MSEMQTYLRKNNNIDKNDFNMDSLEDDIPIIKIHLKTYWYLILLLSLVPMSMLVFPPFFFRDHELWFDIFMGSLVTIAIIIGLLCKNVELIFKIDNADNILIYERFWSKLRINRRSFKLQDIKRFNVFTRNIPYTGGIKFLTGEYNFLALEFISQKPKYLSSLRDSPFTVDYAQRLNNFLESFTSLKKIDLNSRIIPSKHPSAKMIEENYRKVIIILLFILSFCLIVLFIV
ncbi:hypothetical protein LCGC14_2565400, partial [marine sediment metagenome]